MLNNKFALGTYEINLQNSLERTIIINTMSDVCDYIDTAIDYNNDYLFRHAKNYKIISKISSFHANDYEFFVSNHLKCLDRDFIDIMLIHSNRGNWQNVALKMKEDNRFKEIGVSNFTKKDIIEYKNLLGFYPVYNELEINPYYADLETINFCIENKIKIIAYGTLCGKYNSVRMVAAYTLPGLVAFAAKYADIVILKPDSLRHMSEFIDTVKNYDISNMPDIDFITKEDKAIEPMHYSAMPVNKMCLGKPSYSISCGKNTGSLIGYKVYINLPSMEMLGDYATYVRYLYRQNYDNDKDVYYNDFLIGDNDDYYAVYLYDKDNRLTKINEFDKVEVMRYSHEV